jgi:hypothetical protein
MAKSRKTSKMGMMNYAKPAFGMGLGLFGSLIFYMLIAVLLFVPGFIIVKKERAKPKDKQSDGMKALGYILMGFGMIIGMGFGAGIFFGELGGEFDF